MKSDPVTEWFSRNAVEKPTLKHAYPISLPDGGAMRIRTNSDACLTFLRERCGHMTDASTEKRACVDIEMFCLENPSLPCVQPYGHQPIAPDNTFLSVSDPQSICAWRSPDLMGTVDDSRIRVLVTAENHRFMRLHPDGLAFKCRRIPEPSYSDALDLAWCLYARLRKSVLLHGAALERDGRGVLIVGESGAGKTTASLALLRAGFRLLSDEYTLLWKAENSRVLMGGLLVPPMIVGSGFRSLDELEKTLKSRSARKTPAVGVIPSHAHTPTAVDVRMVIALNRPKRRGTKHQALPLAPTELIPILIGQLLDPVRSDRIGIVETLSELALGASAYRVTVGTNLGSLAAFIDAFQGETDGR